MAAKEAYEVLADELTVHRQIGVLRDPVTQAEIGVQQGQGKVYFKGDVIPPEAVSPVLKQILEDEDSPSHESVAAKIKKVTGNKAAGAREDEPREPFPGYDDLSEEDALAAIRHLPSAAIAAAKEYEEANENRSSIVNYAVGFGEDPDARQEGRVGSDADPDAVDGDKAAAQIKTRSVPEDGPVEPGEGHTGTGDPSVEPGTAKAAAKGAARRRGRRARSGKPASAKKSKAKKNDEGDESDDS